MEILDLNGLKKVQSLLTNLIKIHINNNDNPHNVTREQLGLENAVCIGEEISETVTPLLRDTDLFAGYPPEFYAERSSISNPNLLTNPSFKINQRERSLYKPLTGSITYTADRWCTEYHNPDEAIISVTPRSNGINFKVEKGATYINFLQPIPRTDQDLSGKQIVLSFDVNLISGSYGAYIQVLRDDLSSEVISDAYERYHLDSSTPLKLGINLRECSGNKCYLISYAGYYGEGAAHQAVIWLLSCGYNGDAYYIVEIGSAAKHDSYLPTFSVDSGGYIVCTPKNNVGGFITVLRM